MSEPLSALQLFDFTEQVTSKAPTPGGGGVAALIGALAAALGSMATNLTIGKKKYLPFETEHRMMIAEANVLRLRFLELIDADAAAFEPLSRIYSLEKTTPGYDEMLRAATLDACKAPFEIMEHCCKLIALLENLLPKCSVLLLSDVGCAALAARCALESASMNVLVNTGLLPDVAEAGDYASRVEDMLREYVPRAQAVSDKVFAHLRGPA